MSKPTQQPGETGKPEPKIARSKRASQRKEEAHPVFQPNAAGIDIGAREIYVAVPADRGRVEGWRQGSVGSAYPLLPVSFGSASLTEP